MTLTKMLGAALMLAVTAGTPAVAQTHNESMNHGAMSRHSEMKMSTADMNRMMSCHKMTRVAMMKDKRCASMMKMHPDMMKMSGSDMKTMMACRKMSGAAMTGNKRCAAMMKMHPQMMKSS